MSKHKFRISDVIPRAWLRKLKPPGSPHSDGDHDRTHLRKSYHFTRQFDVDQPRHPPSPTRRYTNRHRRSAHLRSSTRRSTPRRVAAAVSSGCSCRTLNECRYPVSPSSSLDSTDAVFPQSPPSFGRSSGSVPSSESFDQMVSWTTTSSSYRCRADLDVDPLMEFELELELPAGITKPPEFNEMVMNLRRPIENKKQVAAISSMNSTSAVSVKMIEEDTSNVTFSANKDRQKPRSTVNSSGSLAGGMRLRVNSPKLATKKLHQSRLQGRKIVSSSASFRPDTNLGSKARKSNVSNGFAVTKSSVDPRKDFSESMVEMIMENDIRSPNDLEDLLAFYLILNSDEYHDLIVGVFKQIWSELYVVRSK